MFASCHIGSSIDAASSNYKSGRHIASAMGKRAGQAPVLTSPAAKMCSQPRASSGVSANNGSVKDAQGVASGGNALGAAVAKSPALSLKQLQNRATSLGVTVRDENKRERKQAANSKKIVGLPLKRSSPRCSRKADLPDLHWTLAGGTRL